MPVATLDVIEELVTEVEDAAWLADAAAPPAPPEPAPDTADALEVFPVDATEAPPASPLKSPNESAGTHPALITVRASAAHPKNPIDAA